MSEKSLDFFTIVKLTLQVLASGRMHDWSLQLFQLQNSEKKYKIEMGYVVYIDYLREVILIQIPGFR